MSLFSKSSCNGIYKKLEYHRNKGTCIFLEGLKRELRGGSILEWGWWGVVRVPMGLMVDGVKVHRGAELELRGWGWGGVPGG